LKCAPWLHGSVAGVTVLAVGVGRADVEELRRAVTDQSPQNLLYTWDAGQLDTLHSDLADLLCGIARIPEVVEHQETGDSDRIQMLENSNNMKNMCKQVLLKCNKAVLKEKIQNSLFWVIFSFHIRYLYCQSWVIYTLHEAFM